MTTESDECEVLYSGSISHSMTGRSAKSKLYDGKGEQDMLLSFHRLGPLVGVKITKIFSGPTACCSFAISKDFIAYSWGRNENGQLGLGDTFNRYNPTMISEKTKYKGGACGTKHTLIIHESGELYSMGQNTSGELGNGKVNDMETTPQKVKDSAKVVNCAAGKNFSAYCDEDGKLYTFGCPEYGQLGNGTDGKTLEKAGKYTFANETKPIRVVALDEVKITDIKCGSSHCCAMDEEGRLYTWGFGGYGRLGQADNKDQYLPLALDKFSEVPPPIDPKLPKFLQRQNPVLRAKEISCGSICTFVVLREPHSALYFWGALKVSQEAQMYPDAYHDLQGYRVDHCSVGISSVILTTPDHLITWGGSPTFGELGLGDKVPKSSTKPQIVTYLEGALIKQIEAGLGQSLILVDMTDRKSKELVEKLEIFNPEEIDDVKALSSSSKNKKQKSSSS